MNTFKHQTIFNPELSCLEPLTPIRNQLTLNYDARFERRQSEGIILKLLCDALCDLNIVACLEFVVLLCDHNVVQMRTANTWGLYWLGTWPPVRLFDVKIVYFTIHVHIC